MRHRRQLSFITCMHSFTQITSRIELRGIVPSNQIKVTFIIILFYPSAWFVFDFFLFHIEIEGNCGWIIGGGGGGGVGPLSNYWVGLTPHLPGRVAQSVEHLTRKAGVLGSIPGLATYFRFPFRFFKKGSCQLLAKLCAGSTG